MSGWGGNSGGGGGGGPPFWNNDCEATTSPADLNGTILAPPEGATYRQGERMDLSWQSGLRSEVLRIDGPPWAGGFHPASWQWSAFLESEDGSTNVTILDNQNFTFAYDVSWRALDDCSNTAINQSWTIPEDLLGSAPEATVFNVVVVNMTNPDPEARSRTTGAAFTVEEGPPRTTAASAPSSVGAATTTTGEPSSISSPTASTAAAPTLTPAPEEGGGSGEGQGLSVGAQAGIGAGVGVSALFFLFALLLLWKRQRRRSPDAGAGSNIDGVDEEKAAAATMAKAERGGAELPGDIGKPADVLREVEAPVPRELAATNPHDDDDDDSDNENSDGRKKTAGSALSVDFDPYAPRYPSGPVEMPANEAIVAEMPDTDTGRHQTAGWQQGIGEAR